MKEITLWDWWQIFCNILAIYAVLQIMITKYLFAKHEKKMEYYPYSQSGGNEESFSKEQEAIKYSNSKKYKRIIFLKKIF